MPIYEFFVGEVKVALLYEPKFEEMFWCSYRIEPVSKKADEILRDERIWENVKFTIKAADGSFPNSNTFGGGSKDFCDGKTNRMLFRSLWPPESRIVKVKRRTLLNKIIGMFRMKTVGEKEEKA